ncbi:MAG TPA: polysaccharide deacetylase family protein [Syntrophorhabdaceae bacterium]|nr:polysaccharide deacetylase family protein [Syntrophorhabdaceae bacterium]
MKENTIVVSVHVDTFEGMKKGVPVLLEIFRKYGIKGSFFVPMGPDHTGRTIKRVFKRKGFLDKTGTGRVWADALSKKTLMYGLLLPGPSVVEKNRDLLLRIVDEGHELGIHGFDHVYWHDRIKYMEREETEKEIEKCLLKYKELVGAVARCFASPGWMINAHALSYFERKGFTYTSDTRAGSSPFYPVMNDRRFHLLQLPTTLPTLDEMIGSRNPGVTDLVESYHGRLTEAFNLLTIHAEIEGRRWSAFLEQFIRKTKSSGFEFAKATDSAEHYARRPAVPVCTIEHGFVEGRAGEVCVQGKVVNSEK